MKNKPLVTRQNLVTFCRLSLLVLNYRYDHSAVNSNSIPPFLFLLSSPDHQNDEFHPIFLGISPKVHTAIFGVRKHKQQAMKTPCLFSKQTFRFSLVINISPSSEVDPFFLTNSRRINDHSNLTSVMAENPFCSQKHFSNDLRNSIYLKKFSSPKSARFFEALSSKHREAQPEIAFTNYSLYFTIEIIDIPGKIQVYQLETIFNLYRRVD